MRKSVPLLVPLAIFCCRAAAFAQGPSPIDMLPMTIREDETRADGLIDGILNHPWVTQADKDLVRKATQPMEDALATLKKDAQAPTVQEISADQQAFDQANSVVMAVFQDRADLGWIYIHARGAESLETRLLEQKLADYTDLIKATGVDAAQINAVGNISQQYKSDVDAMDKQARQTAATDTPAQKLAFAAARDEKGVAVLKQIHALLTLQQRFDLDWAITKPARAQFSFVGFASQPGIVLAPETGTYLLKSGIANAAPKTLASVLLKKGDPIGFKKTDATTTAAAGEQSFDIPAENLTSTCWQFSPG